jgi:hypothetical protein
MVRSGSCGSGARYVLLLRESAAKPVGKPDAGNPHVRFDERGWETGRPKRRQHPRPSSTLLEVYSISGVQQKIDAAKRLESEVIR